MTAHDDDARDVWPVLDDGALYGNAGAIVDLLAPHTEADKPALLVHLLASFGAAAGVRPHIMVGGKRHPALLHPLIVGRTSDGAKGTAWDIVRAVLIRAVPEFAANIVSGLTSGEGVIELVRDPSGDDPDAKDFDPGVGDKRLLVIEEEYRSVLNRSHAEGSRLSTVLRDAWDGNTLASLARKRNKLVATGPHITLIGHITPGELRDSLRDSDLSGGSINRLVLVLSRRSQLHPRLGNAPADEMATASAIFQAAHDFARKADTPSFTQAFWRRWDQVYPELRVSRPDTWAAKSVARGPAQVLRISMLHALFNETDVIDAEHLDAAMALWSYIEAGVWWVFEQPATEDIGPAALEQFILDVGKRGCSRTDISVKHFHRNKTSAQIDAELRPLLDDKRIAMCPMETSGRARTTYVHTSFYEKNENTKKAGGSHDSRSYDERTKRTKGDLFSSSFVPSSYPNNGADQHNSFNSSNSYTETETGSVEDIDWQPETDPDPICCGVCGKPDPDRPDGMHETCAVRLGWPVSKQVDAEEDWA